MELKTLFRAYAKTRDQMEYEAHRFGGRNGIGLSDNEYAVRWRRYRRLADRITARIEGVRVCPVCIARPGLGRHFTTCSRYEDGR